MADGVEELDAAADALYALAPAEFTAARNARAGSARGRVGQQIRALRKPSVAAWAVNLLVRDGQLAEAVELSRALHDAQDELDAPELAKLGRQRRALVAGLARRAGELAGQAGGALSGAVLTEVERTINAAIVDETAGAAVLTGRLIRPVTADMRAEELADAVAGSVPGVPDRPAPARDDLAARRARKAAEASAREADRAASEADREAVKTRARREKARERADLLADRVEDLRVELARIERDARAAEEDARAAEEADTAAHERARTARHAAERARAALEARREE